MIKLENIYAFRFQIQIDWIVFGFRKDSYDIGILIAFNPQFGYQQQIPSG